jgi:carbonic anhydrase
VAHRKNRQQGRTSFSFVEWFETAMLARYFQIQEAELKAKAVTDPRAAVAADVAFLRANPALPGDWLVSGLVYNVATGLIEIVVPPAPIRSERAAERAA